MEPTKVHFVVGMATTGILGFILGVVFKSPGESGQDSTAPRPLILAKPPAPKPEDTVPDRNPVPLDLTEHFNAELVQHDVENANDFSELPSGLQPMLGTTFDIKGVIQLGGQTEKASASKYPERVSGIKVGARCRRVQFLLGTRVAEQPGVSVAKVVIRYADGQTQEAPVVYGKNVLDWWIDPRQPLRRGGAVAWVGSNAAARKKGSSVQLFKLAVDNSRPEAVVESLELVSLMTRSAPFFIAATADILAD